MVRKPVHGEIELHHLSEWWYSEFTDAERQYIESRYKPMGATSHTLTAGDFITGNEGRLLDTASFLLNMATWFHRKEDARILKKIEAEIDRIGSQRPISGPGFVNGRLFVTYIKDVEGLEKARKWKEAEELLLRLIHATEEQSVDQHCGVCSWYYAELAAIYRRQKDYASEVIILERFARRKHGTDSQVATLLKRLEQARKLAPKVERNTRSAKWSTRR